MRVLVTGSAGFIGRHVVRELAAHGHRVLGLDYGFGDSEIAAASVVCDVLNLESLSDRFREFCPDAVIHLAARTDLEARRLEDYAANTQGVANVVAAVRRTPSVQRAIFTSSQLVCRVGYAPRHEADYSPNTLYGQSKVETEKIVREADGGGKVWCLVRPTTVWGPGMGRQYLTFFRMIARGRYFHIGNRPLYKSYGFVANIAHQYLRLLLAPSSDIAGKTFYLADYQPLSLRKWADQFQREMGAPRIRSLPEPLARAAARVGDLFFAVGIKRFPLTTFRLRNILTEYRFDLSETERICGPLPVGIDAGVQTTVAWLRGIGVVARSSR